jgi:hypothetical protein
LVPFFDDSVPSSLESNFKTLVDEKDSVTQDFTFVPITCTSKLVDDSVPSLIVFASITISDFGISVFFGADGAPCGDIGTIASRLGNWSLTLVSLSLEFYRYRPKAEAMSPLPSSNRRHPMPFVP